MSHSRGQSARQDFIRLSCDSFSAASDRSETKVMGCRVKASSQDYRLQYLANVFFSSTKLTVTWSFTNCCECGAANPKSRDYTLKILFPLAWIIILQICRSRKSCDIFISRITLANSHFEFNFRQYFPSEFGILCGLIGRNALLHFSVSIRLFWQIQEKHFARTFKCFFAISSSKEGNIPWEYLMSSSTYGKSYFGFRKADLTESRLEWTLSTGQFEQGTGDDIFPTFNQRKFFCQYDQILFQISIHDSSLDSALKSRIFRNSGTNIELGHSNRVQKIVFLRKKTRKAARWLQKNQILTSQGSS
jgi:hypothetical protein